MLKFKRIKFGLESTFTVMLSCWRAAGGSSVGCVVERVKLPIWCIIDEQSRPYRGCKVSKGAYGNKSFFKSALAWFSTEDFSQLYVQHCCISCGGWALLT